ncbi:signal peptide peptidase SppA [Candidatus Nucleicultrix amoebiphila]|jgi:protease-4|uniref:signal peptide peptidase SppA n=1 Tax=Candidatus Nucleicultrix amoebiphila TaxID=1509244 RepID=UPI000A26EDAE|nr:signal peptide peptidase SppA [Candidatus Nucleicultrix amoebiphila]
MKKWFGRLFRFFEKLSVIIISIVVLSFFAIQFIQPRTASITDKSVLYIKLDRPIFEHMDDNFLYSLMYDHRHLTFGEIIEALKQGESDARIKGLVLEIQANVLGIAQVQELRQALQKFREANKFVLAYSDTFGELSSGTLTYYLAAVADEIWVQPQGFVNITGFAIEMPFLRKLLDEWQINPQIGHREQYKNAMDFLTESALSPANEEAWKTVLDSLMNQFVRDVAIDRDLQEEQIRTLVNDAPFVKTQDALDSELIDHIGYYDEVIHKAKELAESSHSLIPLKDYWHSLPQKKPSDDIIALIYGVGAISRSKLEYNPLTQSQNMVGSEIAKAFEKAFEHPNVKAIVFRVDSPGGSANASETILRQVRRAKEKNIPVIISMGNAAASGGYWISAYANKIVAEPGTITGSIGVFGGKVATEKFWNKLNINWGSIVAGKNADMWSSVRPFNEIQWTKLQDWLDYTYNSFINIVAEGRNLSVDHVKEIAKGRIWTGEEAKKFGLVDELGGLDKAIVLAKLEAKIPLTEKIETIHFPKAKSNFEKLIQFLHGDEGSIEIMMQPLRLLAQDLKSAFGLRPAEEALSITNTYKRIK